MTRPNFEIAMMKGDVGERIVREYLEKRGWSVYKPVTDGSHTFDMMGIMDKKSAIALDVKAKARMNKFNATGINREHFDCYVEFSKKHNMPFCIFFVDEHSKSIYGNTIEELEKPRFVDGICFPFEIKTRYGKTIRLWPCNAMKHIENLSDDDAFKLSSFSQRNYGYEVSA